MTTAAKIVCRQCRDTGEVCCKCWNVRDDVIHQGECPTCDFEPSPCGCLERPYRCLCCGGESLYYALRNGRQCECGGWGRVREGNRWAGERIG